MESLECSDAEVAVEPMGSHRWKFVILGFVIMVCLGTVYSWSVFRTPIAEMYGLDASASGLPYLLFLIVYTVFMLFSGKLVDTFNPKLLIFIGGMLMGLGWILSGLAASFSMVVFSYGVITGVGAGVVNGVPINIVNGWFKKERGVALGLLLSGFGLSPLVTAPVIKMLINNVGVHHAFLFIGIVFFVLVPVLGLFFQKPAQTGVDDPKLEEKAATAGDGNVLLLVRNKKFIGLWFCFMMASTVGLLIIGISSQIGEEIFRIDSNVTAKLLSIFALCNALGRPVFGYITNRFGPRTAAMLSFALVFAVALLLQLAKGHTVFVYILALSVFWFNLGAWLAIASTTTGMQFGQKNYSRNYGVLFTAYGLGAVIGTPLASLLRMRYGSYLQIFLPIAILSAVGMAVAMLTMRVEKETFSH